VEDTDSRTTGRSNPDALENGCGRSLGLKSRGRDVSAKPLRNCGGPGDYDTPQAVAHDVLESSACSQGSLAPAPSAPDPSPLECAPSKCAPAEKPSPEPSPREKKHLLEESLDRSLEKSSAQEDLHPERRCPSDSYPPLESSADPQEVLDPEVEHEQRKLPAAARPATAGVRGSEGDEVVNAIRAALSSSPSGDAPPRKNGASCGEKEEASAPQTMEQALPASAPPDLESTAKQACSSDSDVDRGSETAISGGSLEFEVRPGQGR